VVLTGLLAVKDGQARLVEFLPRVHQVVERRGFSKLIFDLTSDRQRLLEVLQRFPVTVQTHVGAADVVERKGFSPFAPDLTMDRQRLLEVAQRVLITTKAIVGTADAVECRGSP
jgi:hypothetical protein